MNCVFPDRVGTSMFFGSPATSSFGWKYWICHFACLKGGYTVFNLENCAPHKCHKNLKWNLLYYLRKMLRLSHIPTSLTDSSRGLKSVCKFKICKNFAKILHRRKILFSHFAKNSAHFFKKFCKIFCKFFVKNVQKFLQKK